MRLVIIPSDSTVYVNGESRNIDVSSINIPSNIHALQWYSDKGWIEFKDPIDPFQSKLANEYIVLLPEWASECIAAWGVLVNGEYLGA